MFEINRMKRLALFTGYGLTILSMLSGVSHATSEPGDPNQKPGLQQIGDPALTDADVQTKANTINFAPPSSQKQRDPIASSPSRQSGVLSGRIIYCNAGHGWQWNSTLGRWATDRGVTNSMVEDLGNHDQFNYYVNYLFNAGATIAPFRPVGNQTNEAVLDNDDSTVTFSGTWSNSASTQYFGQAGDTVSYRFTASALTETAVATYRPNIPAPGFYPVYTWVLNSSNRSADQLYRIIHSGGVSEVNVNHIRVGRGWVYLGTYYLEAGTNAYVEISNKSVTAGTNIIADAIRFGNGMGDVIDNTISGFPREDESSPYWNYRALGQGGDPGIYSAGSVAGPPMMAAYMNNSGNGSITDRLFMSIHSNAGGGRGALGLINSGSSVWDPTPNQALLAQIMGSELNIDMRAVNSKLPTTWSTRTSYTYTSEFGEMRNDLINGEMDSQIVETAFHDDSSDALIMRTPIGRQLIGRAMLHATIKYFNQVPGGGGSALFPPDAPVNPKAVSNGNGTVTVSWSTPPADPAGSGSATSYVVYKSSNGYGFGNPVTTNGTQQVLTGFGNGETVYLRIASRNSAGESFPTETLAVRVAPAAANPVLIVNAFDRADASSNVSETRANLGTVQRVKPWRSNNSDYVVQHAKALTAANRYFDSTSNEALNASLVNNYQALVWISGEEATSDEAFSNTEQTIVTNFLNQGRGIFVSGAEIGWDLQAQSGGQTFYNSMLMTNYASDDANTYGVNAGTGIFAGVPALTFGGIATINNTVYPPVNAAPYDVDYPDTISAINGSSAVLNYTGGAVAAVAGTSGSRKVISLAFPFECITTESTRNSLMQASMNYLGIGQSGVKDWSVY